jgi:hypothetical protein
MKRIILAITLSTIILGVPAQASEFLQLSLTPDVALHSKDTTIGGISLNIWGENPQSAFALGFVNGSTGSSRGFSWGLLNYSDTYKGVDFGFVNLSSKLFVGWQAGMVNITKEAHGLQMGFFNYTESLKGLQLGFVNVVTTSPWFDEFPDKLAKGFVFVNWSF